MEVKLEDLLKKLKSKNIRLSHQRLKVLEYLTQNCIHPTADQIYNGIHDDVPTLSRTTVYNTLNSLVKAGLVEVINIEGNEPRYDINTTSHGHFKCGICKKIYDFEIDINSVETHGLNGFDIHDRNVYFKGICPNCRANIKK